jgi:hypothetical protein
MLTWLQQCFSALRLHGFQGEKARQEGDHLEDSQDRNLGPFSLLKQNSGCQQMHKKSKGSQRIKMVEALTNKTPILRLQASDDFFLASSLSGYVLAQGTFRVMKSFSKTLDSSSIRLSFLASFFALLKLRDKVISTLSGFRKGF